MSPFPFSENKGTANSWDVGVLIERHSTKDVTVFSSFVCLPVLLLMLNLFLSDLEVIESTTLAFRGKPAVGLGEEDMSM